MFPAERNCANFQSGFSAPVLGWYPFGNCGNFGTWVKGRLRLLGTVFVMSYWYWHIVAQAENLLVEALSNEVKGYVMRMEYSGQVWHLEQLGAEVAAKYPDLQFHCL